MNSAHDLGGQMAFGPVIPEPNEPVFHGDWEKRVLAINVAAGAMGAWTIDEIRHARESLPPAQYLSSTYYEIWLAALDKVLVKHGFLSPDELATGRPSAQRREPKRVLKGEEVAGDERRRRDSPPGSFDRALRHVDARDLVSEASQVFGLVALAAADLEHPSEARADRALDDAVRLREAELLAVRAHVPRVGHLVREVEPLVRVVLLHPAKRVLHPHASGELACALADHGWP